MDGVRLFKAPEKYAGPKGQRAEGRGNGESLARNNSETSTVSQPYTT